MPPGSAEIKAVVKALEDEYPEDATSKDMALRIIQALDVQREKSDKWVTVMQIKLPENDGWHYFAIGPFSTVKQAQSAGETTLPNTMKYKRDGDGRYRAIPIVSNERSAWESIRPEHVDHMQYIKDAVADWSPSKWMDLVKQKEGWGHKPSPVKDEIDKIEEHS